MLVVVGNPFPQGPPLGGMVRAQLPCRRGTPNRVCLTQMSETARSFRRPSDEAVGGKAELSP